MRNLSRLSTSSASRISFVLNLGLRLLCGLLLGVSSSLLSAQTVSFSGAATGVDFPNANVCPVGQTTPAPCSQTMTLTYNVTAGGTLGTPKVLTTGAPNLDYTLASGSTCAGAVTEGTTCTVKVTLAPRYAGERKGAVQIVDGSGNVLATTLLHGIGVGPQIAFDPSPQTTLGPALSEPVDPTVDELGNVYLLQIASDPEPEVLKVPADGGTPTMIGTGLHILEGVGLDGAGNVFISDAFPENQPGQVVEVLATGSGQITLPFTGLGTPVGVAVDGSGNVFLANEALDQEPDDSLIIELPAGGGDQMTLPSTGLNFPNFLALDSSGDVFASNFGPPPSDNAFVLELPAGGGTPKTLPFSGLHTAGEIAVDAAGDVFVEDPTSIEQVPAGASGFITIRDFPPPGNLNGIAVSSAGNLFLAEDSAPVVVLHRSQPAPLSFADTPLGTTTSPQSMQIQNIGNATLSLSGLSVSGNFASVPGSGTPADCTASSSLAPGARCNISINFTPENLGPLTGTVTLSDNALNNSLATQVVQLSGIGGPLVPPLAQVSATTLQFGTITYPGTKTLPLTVKNIGGGTLTVTPSISFRDYTITSNSCSSGLTAGNSCTLQIEHAPVGIGIQDETLTLRTNGSSNPTVALKGVSAGITTRESTLQFGTIRLGTVNMPLELTVTNYGLAGTFTIGTAFSGSSYQIAPGPSNNTCQAGLAEGKSCSMWIYFIPTSPGPHGETVTITPSGGVNPITVNLYGTASQVAATVKTLQFGTIPVGTTEVLPLTIYNNGVDGKVIINTAVEGTSYKILTTTQNTCQAGLKEGHTCILPVEFAPASVGRHGELLDLTFGLNGVGVVGTVNLYGDALAAP